MRPFAWGIGCGLVLVVTAVAMLLYVQRPKRWDVQALHVKNATARPFSELNEKLAEVSSGVTFSVDVENTTAMDVTLPSTLRVMGQTRGSHSLHGSLLKLGAEYFLPAHHVTTISLDRVDLCAANPPPQECFDRYFKDDESIILFDEPHMYEILIAIPAFSP